MYVNRKKLNAFNINLCNISTHAQKLIITIILLVCEID